MKKIGFLLLLIPHLLIGQNNVGIGTTSPLSKLHIVGNSSIPLPQLRLTETESDYARIKLESSLHPGAYWDIAGRADSITGSSRINFYFANGANNGDRMTITGIGDVGIGTTIPDAKLDILGGDWNLDAGNAGDLRIGNPTFNFRLGVVTSGANSGTVRMYSNGNSLLLGTNNTPHLAITTSGNVGIGATGPASRLRIVGLTTSSFPVLSVSNSYVGTTDVRAIEGFSSPSAGYGIGGYFLGGYRGVQATGQGQGYTGEVIALDASATGTAGTRTAIYASATGGTTNWAGYFANGNVYVSNQLRIGAAALAGVSGYKIVVDGKIIAEEIRVQLSDDWPDYVFDPDYELLSLGELEQSIKRHHHLPNIPSADEVEEGGILVGDMQSKMLRKIEELTLYIIDLNKEYEALQKRLADVETQIKNREQ